MSSNTKASQSNTTYDQKITTGGEAITAAHNSSISIQTLDADLAERNLALMQSLAGEAIGSTRSLAEDVLYAAGGAMADMRGFSESTIGTMAALADGTATRAYDFAEGSMNRSYDLTEKVLAINDGLTDGNQAMADNMLTTMRDFMGKLTGETDAKISGGASMSESSKNFFERNPALTLLLGGGALLAFLGWLMTRRKTA
jgi:hypothetical protein